MTSSESESEELLFTLYCHKVLPCSRRTQHDWSQCPFAHPGEKARRRNLRTHYYDSKMCPCVAQGRECPAGSSCPHSHTVFESWLHPEKYKTTMCKDADKGCTRKVCFFAHSFAELRVPTPACSITMADSTTQHNQAATAAAAASAFFEAAAPAPHSRGAWGPAGRNTIMAQEGSAAAAVDMSCSAAIAAALSRLSVTQRTSLDQQLPPASGVMDTCGQLSTTPSQMQMQLLAEPEPAQSWLLINAQQQQLQQQHLGFLVAAQQQEAISMGVPGQLAAAVNAAAQAPDSTAGLPVAAQQQLLIQPQAQQQQQQQQVLLANSGLMMTPISNVDMLLQQQQQAVPSQLLLSATPASQAVGAAVGAASPQAVSSWMVVNPAAAAAAHLGPVGAVDRSSTSTGSLLALPTQQQHVPLQALMAPASLLNSAGSPTMTGSLQNVSTCSFSGPLGPQGQFSSWSDAAHTFLRGSSMSSSRASAKGSSTNLMPCADAPSSCLSDLCINGFNSSSSNGGDGVAAAGCPVSAALGGTAGTGTPQGSPLSPTKEHTAGTGAGSAAAASTGLGSLKALQACQLLLQQLIQQEQERQEQQQ